MNILSNTSKPDGSRAMCRAGILVLGLLVTTYLAAVTFSLVDQLNSPRRVAIFFFLWLLGLVALVLLVRAWRHSYPRRDGVSL